MSNENTTGNSQNDEQNKNEFVEDYLSYEKDSLKKAVNTAKDFRQIESLEKTGDSLKSDIESQIIDDIMEYIEDKTGESYDIKRSRNARMPEVYNEECIKIEGKIDKNAKIPYISKDIMRPILLARKFSVRVICEGGFRVIIEVKIDVR